MSLLGFGSSSDDDDSSRVRSKRIKSKEVDNASSEVSSKASSKLSRTAPKKEDAAPRRKSRLGEVISKNTRV